MSLPTPAALAEEVQELDGLLKQLVSDYRWGHGVVFDRSSGESSGDTVLGEDGKPPKAPGPGRSRNDVAWSDPTGNTVVDRERMRAQLGQAAGRLLGARENVDKALEALGRVFADRSETYASPPGPRTATRAEVQDSHDAKGRRQSRGEDFGEA